MTASDNPASRRPKSHSAELSRSALEAELPPELSNLPPKQKAEVISYAVEIAEQHSGPLPHPQTLGEYDQIMPGLAERIVAMAEGDLRHRQDMQRRGFAAEATERRIGQIGAMLITLTALLVSGWIATAGYPLTGGILGGATLIGVVSIFIGGREYLLSKLDREPLQRPDKSKRQKR
ncbi:DUF2335 domain-containing protein [uncultured Bosea sp.]|uniref:DUF2335 domain-containing protein n=1 Tax=uncultured Bosea sp. TaxID=211457 RepID=UPI0025D6CD45|nr:DUF2335 domain-containing protein [uncultured Bosea sp.]